MLGKPIRVSELNPNFKLEVITHEAARDITACFSCGTCTAGCPIHEAYPEYDPRRVARMVNLGMRSTLDLADWGLGSHLLVKRIYFIGEKEE
jgi:heterodisulfide reductase subunit C